MFGYLIKNICKLYALATENEFVYVAENKIVSLDFQTVTKYTICMYQNATDLKKK